MKRGVLIAFEGIDGAGKSTQVSRLAAALRARGHDVVETREPTDGSFGARIREVATQGRRAAAEEELAWFVADRREHVLEVIEPALSAAKVVLTDRYFLSTVGYQGARGLDPERLLRDAETEFPAPDLALLFEIDPAVGLERVGHRGGVREAGFEDHRVLREVDRVFRSLDRPYLVRIDGRGTPERVHARVVEAVDRALPELGARAGGE